MSAIGDFFTPVALAFAVLELRGSATDLGLVLAAQTVPMLALLLVGGVWADRLSRKRVLITCEIVRGCAQGLTAGLVISGEATIWRLVCLQAAHGAATAFFRPALTGLVPQTVPAADLQRANSLFFVSQSVGNVLSPAAAGLLVAGIGPGWAIAIDAGSFFAGALLLLRLPAFVAIPRARPTFLSEIAAGWSEVRSRTWLWATILNLAVFQMVVLGAFGVLGPLVARNSLGGASAWGVIVAAWGGGAVLGSLVSYRVRPARPLFTIYLLILSVPLGLVGLALEAPVALIAGAEVLAGLAQGFAGAVWETTIQERVPSEALSRVASYNWLGALALRPVGFVIAGPIAAAVGLSASLLGAAAIVAGSALVALSVGQIRSLARLTYPERHKTTASPPDGLPEGVAAQPPSS
jgi:MFS family permease